MYPSHVQLLEQEQRRVNPNTFPDYRNVFDGNQRTLFTFGGKPPRPYANPWAHHWQQPVAVFAQGGHVLPQKVGERPIAQPGTATFPPFYCYTK